MIHSKDPSRLFEREDTPRELREWLTDARKHKPSALQVQSLVQAVTSLQGLEASGLQPVGHPPAPQAYATGAGKSLIATKLAATVAVGLATAGVGIYYWDGLSPQRSAAAMFEPARASDSNLDSRELPITESVPYEGAARERTSPVEELTPHESAATEEQTSPATSPLAPTHHARRRHTAENHRPAPTLQTSDVTGEKTSERASERTSERAVLAERQAEKLAEAKAPLVATDNRSEGTEEWRTLRAARQAVSTDPQRALALVQEHAQKFPRGMLCQEREAIAIDALARLGRTGEAQRRATAFAGKFPTSPYRSRNEASLSRSGKSGSKP